MKICICGWYFYTPFLKTIRDSPYSAYVVKNREGDTCDLPGEMSDRMSETGGRGLEFGAYQQYLMKHWDGSSDVLFMQDDGTITPEALMDIENLAHRRDIDQAFLFRDEYEEFVNGGHSGRAFWMRANVVGKFKAAGGFEVDWDNTGNTEGRQANGMIHAFAKTMSSNYRCGWIGIIPGLQMGRRGWIPNQPWQYKRMEGQHGLVTPESIL
jgi:hypothetical protein